MSNLKELWISQIVFGAVFTLLAMVIAINFNTLITLNQSVFNGLLLAFVAVFLLKDGLPNFILGLVQYVEHLPKGETL